jgi:hypothetical protein
LFRAFAIIGIATLHYGDAPIVALASATRALLECATRRTAKDSRTVRTIRPIARHS